MKMIFTILFSFIIVSFANAAIRTVSNSSGLPAQYNSLPAAITASNAGDTLYVYGTDIDYGNIALDKKIAIIGTGPFPFSKLNSQRTYINGITLTTSSDGSVLRGFETYYIQTDASVDNISIKNVSINNYLRIYGNNWLIENDVFTYNNGRVVYFEYNSSSNITIQNCYISGYISRNGKSVTGSIFRNNLFIGVGDAFSDNITADITNNIFCKNATPGSGSSVFKNNLTCNGVNAIPNTFPNADNVNSAAAANSVFVEYVYNEPFYLSRNYHLAAGSPAIGIAYGGGDAGIYGGSSPGTSSQNELFPNIPVIKYMLLNSTSVQQGGNLDVKIKAFKQN